MGGRGCARITGCRRGGSGARTPRVSRGSSGPKDVPRGAQRGGGRQGRVQPGAAGIPARLPVPDPSAALLLGGWRAGPAQPTIQEEHAHRDPHRDLHSPHTETSGHESLPATACPGLPSSGGTGGLVIGPSPAPAPQEQAGIRAGPHTTMPPTHPAAKCGEGRKRAPLRSNSLSAPCQHRPNLLKEGPQSKQGVLSAGVLLHSLAVSASPRMRLSRPHKSCPTAAGRPQPPGATHMRRGRQASRGSERRPGLL